MTTSEPGSAGYIELFNGHGNAVTASRWDLLAIEAMSFDIRLWRRVTNDTEGTYWLISNRPGIVPMVLMASFYTQPDERTGGIEWKVSYSANGVASYPHFDVEQTLTHLTGRRQDPLPAPLISLVRQHVAYREGARSPSDDARMRRIGVRTLPDATMRRRLERIEHGDVTDLLKLAGEQTAIVELELAALMTADKLGHNELYALFYMLAMVPVRSWPKLVYLMVKAKRQAG